MDNNREKIIGRLQWIINMFTIKYHNEDNVADSIQILNDIEACMYSQNSIKLVDDILSFIKDKEEYKDLQNMIDTKMNEYYLNYEVDVDYVLKEE